MNVRVQERKVGDPIDGLGPVTLATIAIPDDDADSGLTMVVKQGIALLQRDDADLRVLRSLFRVPIIDRLGDSSRHLRGFRILFRDADDSGK